MHFIFAASLLVSLSSGYYSDYDYDYSDYDQGHDHHGHHGPLPHHNHDHLVDDMWKDIKTKMQLDPVYGHIEGHFKKINQRLNNAETKADFESYKKDTKATFDKLSESVKKMNEKMDSKHAQPTLKKEKGGPTGCKDTVALGNHQTVAEAVAVFLSTPGCVNGANPGVIFGKFSYTWGSYCTPELDTCTEENANWQNYKISNRAEDELEQMEKKLTGEMLTMQNEFKEIKGKVVGDIEDQQTSFQKTLGENKAELEKSMAAMQEKFTDLGTELREDKANNVDVTAIKSEEEELKNTVTEIKKQMDELQKAATIPGSMPTPIGVSATQWNYDFRVPFYILLSFNFGCAFMYFYMSRRKDPGNVPLLNNV